MAQALDDHILRDGPPPNDDAILTIAPELSFLLEAAGDDGENGMEWISVSERLPEEDHYVLVCHQGCGVHIAKLTPEEDDMIQCWRIDGGNDVTISAFSHWMPLPEPPTDRT
jgi:hypothetical protein